MAIEFILDKEQEKLEDELDQVLQDLRGTPEERRASFVLAQFTKRLLDVTAGVPEHKRLKPVRHVPKLKFTRPKVTPVTKVKPEQLEVYPVPFPGMPEPPEFTTKKVTEAEPRNLETPPPVQVTPEGIEKKPLIIDRETNLPLAEAEISKELYKVIEEPLTQKDIKVLMALEKKLGKHPSKVLSKPKKLTKLTKKYCKKNNVPFTPENYRKLRYHLIKEVINLGKIDPLFNDQDITEINCEGPEKPVKVKYKGRDLNTNIHLKTNEEINHIIKQLGKKAKTEVGPKNPLLETTLGDKKVVANYGTDWVPPNFKITKANNH